MIPESVVLVPHTFSHDLEEVMAKLRARTVGQDHAVEAYGRILETWSLRPVTHQNTRAGAGQFPRSLPDPESFWGVRPLSRPSKTAPFTGLIQVGKSLRFQTKCRNPKRHRSGQK